MAEREPRPWPDALADRITRPGFLATALLILVPIYLWGALLQANHANTDFRRGDQGKYLEFAKALRADPDALTDRNRMPLYIGLQSVVYRDGMSDDEFFARGKRVNIAISLVALAVVYLLSRRRVGRLCAGSLTFVAAFTVFVFKAGFVQAEVLFYLLNFAAFVGMCETLRRPTLALGAGTGLVLGLAHLTKASVLPGLVLFLAVSVYAAWCARGSGEPALRHVAAASLAVFAFALVIAPYAINSKRVFGRYLYNVNSTFYIWYDSWEEAKAGTRAHGDRVGWPTLPADQIPSARRYFATHTPGEIAARVAKGFGQVMAKVVRSYGYQWYFLVWLACSVALLIRARAAVRAKIRERRPLAFFAVAYFLGYLLLYSFYAPIAAGNRLVLSQLVPAMFSLGWLVAATGAGNRIVTWRGRRIRAWPAFNVAIIALVLAYLPALLGSRLSRVYGGE